MTEASFRLVVRTGPNPGMVFELIKEVSLIGRDVTNDIVVGDAEVSRQHARLTRTPGGYVLEDLGSTNGSFVNGERLVAPRVLNPGDLIGFGENVTMTFDATSPEAAATVMSATPKPVEQPPPPQIPATPAPAVQAAPSPEPAYVPPAPAVAEPSSSRRWVVAGAGCLVLIVVCVITLFLMDAFAPDILYAPLRLLGFS